MNTEKRKKGKIKKQENILKDTPCNILMFININILMILYKYDSTLMPFSQLEIKHSSEGINGCQPRNAKLLKRIENSGIRLRKM